MCTELDISAEYVVIRCDRQYALALKMDLDVKAPNILTVDEHCVILPLLSPSETFKELAIGDRLRVTKIRSEKEGFAIPMCTRRNAVHWYESSTPRPQAAAIETYVTMRVERIEGLAFTRKMNRGKLNMRQRFFDPFDRRERNVPGHADPPPRTANGLIRMTYVKLPDGTKAHSRIKCYVPADYMGTLTHYVLTGEDTYFVETQQPVYEPVSFAELADSELYELTKLLASSVASTEDATFGKLLTAVAALVKCCTNKEWRQEDHPSILSVEECTRIVQKHAYPDLEQPKYGILAKLLKAALTRLTRKEDEDGTNSTTFIE